MKMTASLKKVLILLVSVVCAICTFMGVMSYTNQKANANTIYEAKTIEEVTFSMINGAQIRLSEEDETSGIRFGAKLSVVDYEGLKANGYKSLRFGMIIAPAEYADENAFTVENLFDATAKYNWPTWDGEKWVNPTPNSMQKTVINIFNTKMTLNGNGTEDAADDYYEIKGAITKIQDANLWREFVGVGYIQATDASGDHYIVATPADNERSIATVATVWQDDFIEEIYNGPTDARVDIAKEQSAKVQKVYGDKLESKFTYKGLQIVDVSVENAEWIYEGVSNVTALYDKNFRKVEFKNVTDGVKLVNAPANGEHDFYAVTENGNYKIKLVGATHQISDYAELDAYVNERDAATDSQDDYAVLTNDIDCEGQAVQRSNSIAYYGHFNGLGHTIKNYTSNAYGLFGGNLIKYPVIENVALYFIATSSTSAALAANGWNSGTGFPYVKNLYVKITCNTGVTSTCGLFSGSTNQSYRFANCVIDVTDATVEYAIHKTATNNATVTECYALGAPTQGKLAAEGNNSKNAYINTISASEKVFYSDYAQEICLANGFSEYWSIKDGAIYFGSNFVVDAAEVKETIYKDADFEINASEILGETAKKILVNGVEKTLTDGKLVISIADYDLKVNNEVRVVGATKVIVQPFVKATVVIESGEEFLTVLSNYKGKTASGAYIVLAKDITLPAMEDGMAKREWFVDASNANNTIQFRSAHFDGLGHNINCENIIITGAGLFGDVRFSIIENVSIVKASANEDCPIIGKWAFASGANRTQLYNVYAECDYDGVKSSGLIASGNAKIENCVVKITNASGGYALSNGVTYVTNCYAIGSLTTKTNLTADDNTVIYAKDADLFTVATTNFTSKKGFHSYWQVKTDGVYFGSTLVISANA